MDLLKKEVEKVQINKLKSEDLSKQLESHPTPSLTHLTKNPTDNTCESEVDQFLSSKDISINLLQSFENIREIYHECIS